MLEHKVIELMNQHTRALLIRQTSKEVGIVNHLEISILIDTDAGGRDGRASLLLNTTRERSEEGLSLHESKAVVIEIEVGH